MSKRMWAVACAGLVAGGTIIAQPPRLGPDKTAPVASTAPGAVKGDSLAAVLGDARTALGKVRDYTCTFTRQERRNGMLSGEEVAEMKVRARPAGVYVRFARPEAVAGAEVAYTGTRKDGKVRYRPAGAGSRGFMTLSPDDTRFRADHRHPTAEWGMAGVLDRVATAVAREKALNNPVEVYTGTYQFAGRNVTRYEIFTRRPHAFRHAHRMLVFVDKETHLPVRYEAYDQPKPGAAVGELIEAYSFTDVKLNVGLGEATFDR